MNPSPPVVAPPIRAQLLRRANCAIALVVVVGFGCASARPKPSPSEEAAVKIEKSAALEAKVSALREEARKLLLIQSELSWRNWVYGDPLDLAATYRGHEALFSPASVDLVRRLHEATVDPAARRALEFFRLYLVGEAVGRAVAPLSDQAANLEAEATFATPGGESQPYRELNRLLANESSYDRRGQLSDSALSVVRKLNPILEKKEAVTQRLLGELGYPSYAAFGAELRGADLAALAKLADRVLTETETLYRTAMERELRREIGLTLMGMRRADVPRFNRGADLDPQFPAAELLPRLRATLLGLGIDLNQQKNLRIDDAPLPKKNPRAVCFPVVVPTDIRMSVKPLGGVSDYQALFHESGHAEHYAHTTTKVFEFQQLGDGAPTEAYAFVLENLISNPRWLAEKSKLSGEKLEAFVRGAAVKRLYMLRRYAGKLLFEIGWHAGAPAAGGSADPKALYRKELSRAYAFPVSEADAERYLVDHDDFFYSADYFRAWFLAAQIEGKLVQRFGPSWWDRPEAGAALKELWSHGNELSVDEIAQKLGDPALRTEPLLEQLEGALTIPAR